MRIHLDHSRVASHLVVIGFQGRDCPTRTGPAYLAIVSTLLSQPPPLTAHHSTLFISLSVYNMGVEVPSDPAPNGYVSNPHQEKIDEALRYLRSEKQGGEGWENIDTKDGIILEKKYVQGDSSAIPIVRGHGLVKDLSAQALLSTILQPSARHLWDERFASGALLERYGRRTYKFYSVQKGVGWLVSERDIVGVQHVQDGENGAFEVVQTSVEGDPDNSGRVRATLTCAGWSVVPRGNDLEVAYVVKINPNGSIPSAVVGKIVQDIPLAVVNITNFIRNKVVDVEKRHHEIRLIAGDTDEELKIAVDPKLFGGNWSVGVTGDGVAAEKDGDNAVVKVPAGTGRYEVKIDAA
ncbi:start domain-containing protein [Rhizoctonia solani]|uniref:Start domain-containing protein n=1 Tax=Rhizoctonia solani TaxID=456999 RepID=A0A8H8P3N2_9AGAM|nr:start domain-containing protein [Rhizoctonia solani]QRW25081.1 start domain-containing protein [Rhizoctonia solani]